MKTYKYLGLLLVALCFTTACTEEDVDEVLAIDHTGGLIEVVSTNLNYVVGNDAAYAVNLVAYHGNNPIQEIEVYKTYTSAGVSSNTELLRTIELTGNGNKEAVSFAVDYAELIQGLIFNGDPVPSDDSLLNIADSFVLTYVSYTASGDSSRSQGRTKLTVSTRYAGVYTVVESVYMNSGNNLGNWTGSQVIIESVDASVYRHVGLAFWDDQEYYFTIDPDTYAITILNPYSLLLNTSPAMTCNGGAGAFEVLPCIAKATPDDVNGHDILEFTIGYFRGVGATREFYEKLVKN